MKILNINNFFSAYGGAEQIAYNISTLLKDQGMEQIYFALDLKPYLFDSEVDTSFFSPYSNRRKFNVKKPWQILNYFYNYEVKKALKKQIEQTKPNVILLHNFMYNLTPSVVDVCHETKIRTILFLHDVRLFCPGGLLAYDDTYCYEQPCVSGSPIPCIKHKCKMDKTIPSIIATLNAWFLRYKKVLEKVDFIVCPSQALQELAVKFGVNQNKIRVIPHYLSNNQLKLTSQYDIKYDPFFLYVGRLDNEKGVHFLLEAMTKLPKSIKLKIIGDGYQASELKEYARANGIEQQVLFCGKLYGDTLWHEYATCLTTILPANWFESFGLTILESFLFKKCVIGTNLGAIPELIKNNHSGLIIEPANANQLAEAMLRLFSDIASCKQMGEVGYNALFPTYEPATYWNSFEPLLY